jgi:hypothetical protein
LLALLALLACLLAAEVIDMSRDEREKFGEREKERHRNTENCERE